MHSLSNSFRLDEREDELRNNQNSHWTLEGGYKIKLNRSVSYPAYEFGGDLGIQRIFKFSVDEWQIENSCSRFEGYKVSIVRASIPFFNFSRFVAHFAL